MAQSALVEAYESFMATAKPFITITSDSEHEAALEALEQVLESAEDTPDDPMNPLIDMLSHAIEQYESHDEGLMAFVTEAEGQPADVALLRTLMSQHHLKGSDLPEIGSRSMVSKVLSGERDLSRPAIEKLSARFGLQPSWFFGEASA